MILLGPRRAEETFWINICAPQVIPQLQKLPKIEIDALVMNCVKLVPIIVWYLLV